MIGSRYLRLALVLGIVPLFGSCLDSAPTQGAASPSISASIVPPLLVAQAPALLICPSAVSATGSVEIGPNGGSFSLYGHSISMPAGALRNKVTLNLSAPAGYLVLISITASGQDHLRFSAPVSITLSYSHCESELVSRRPLSVWYLGQSGGWVLEYMGGVDDKAARTVTFETSHLSTYALAH